MITIAPPQPTVSAGILAAPALSAALADLVVRVAPSVVSLGQRGGGNGAGVIWRSDGVIVTNRHVVRGDRVDVWTADERHFTGIVAARHPDRDLAVVKVAAEELPAIEVGDSATVVPGQLAIAVGHPVGYRHAATVGVVVASGQATTSEGPRTGDWIQADVTLLPGNSGGPLLDAAARVIGINTMVSGDLSLAVPSLAVEHFVAGDRPGSAQGFIGVSGQVVLLRRADHPAGFLLTEIAEGAPADRAGLIVGDVVVRVGGTPVTDQETLPGALLRLQPGAAIELEVLRGGEPRSSTVVPTERA